MSLELLGLPADADEAAVKARWRELARQHHPDRGGSAEEFHRWQQAYEAALKEVGLGQTLAHARLQLNTLRDLARGTTCPRCRGTGCSSRRQVGFREFKTTCLLCRGKGVIQ